MKAQEIFDTVAKHLFAQGERSFGLFQSDNQSEPREQCLYRGPNGLKCAVGVLIPDDEYRPSIEGETASLAVAVCGLTELEEHDSLLCHLQSVHDEAHLWNRTDLMHTALRDVACRYSLNSYILSTLSFKDR